MSLNGDLSIMRNGRSTSQVSVYNYPEHLNPFYEEDQHKRLRFWKINKKGNNEGRRNSFSISNLRDIWSFKSFSLKKKSSTLGINKSSESPPLLRRQYADGNYLTSTDQRGRYVVSAHGSPALSDYFTRETPYRSSLQNIPSNTQAFNRNDQYRNTIQLASSSPMQRKPHYLRTSQTSLASTNPFESDDEDNDARSIRSNATTKSTPRKKRKAPPPPPSRKSLLGDDISKSNNFNDSGNKGPLHIEEEIDILNLTAEIEDFVKITYDDSCNINIRNKKQPEQLIKESSKAELETASARVVSDSASVDVRISETEPHTVVHSTVAPIADKMSLRDNTVPSIVVTTESISIDELAPPTSKEENTLPNRDIAIVQNNVKESETKSKEEKLTENGDCNRKKISTEINLESIKATNLPKSHKSDNVHKPILGPKPEVGKMEVINVRRDSRSKVASNELKTNNVSSFQTMQEPTSSSQISNKTPFVLCNPPEKINNGDQLHKCYSKEVADDVSSRTYGSTVSYKANILQHSKNVGERINAKLQYNILNKNVTVVSNDHGEAPLRSSTYEDHATESKPKLEQFLIKTENIEDITINEAGDCLPKNSYQATEQSQAETRNKLKMQTFIGGQAAGNEKKPSTTPASARIEFVDLYSKPLKIVEQNIAVGTDCNAYVQNTMEQDQILRRDTTTFEARCSNIVAPAEPKSVTKKRKSVKDIIDSINRSQRLLNESAAKGTQVYATTPLYNGDSLSLNIQNNAGSHDANNEANSHSAAPTTTKDADEMQEKPDNIETNIQKYKVNKVASYQFRESSPTSSNLDWNPLPKPKRTKNLPDI